MYSMIEYPGLTVDEQINLMKKLNIYSPEIEDILRWHPKDCPTCGQKYFPSGSQEQKCWKCNKVHRKKYKAQMQHENKDYYKLYMRKYRKNRKAYK